MGRLSILLLALPLCPQADPSYEPYATLGDNTSYFHEGNVLAFAFFPDGKQIVSCTDRKQIIVWDNATGKPTAQAQTPFRAESLAVTPDGKQIVAGTSTGTAVFMDWPGLTSGRTVSATGTQGVVLAPNAARAVSQSKDKLDFLNLSTGKVLSEPHKHPPDPFPLKLAISPDGESAVSADSSGLVRVWKTATGKSSGSQIVAGVGPFTHASFSGDGKQFAVHRNGIAFTAFDAANPAQPATWPGYQSIQAPANHSVTVAISSEALVTLDPKSGMELSRFDRPGPDSLRPMLISPDAKQVAIVVDQQSLKVLSLPDLKEPVPPRGPSGRIFDLALSRKGDRIAAVGVDGSIHVWGLAAKQPVRSLDVRFPQEAHLTSATSLRWTADGLSIDGMVPYRFGRWNVATGVLSADTRCAPGSVFRALVPDGESVVAVAGAALQRLLPAAGNRVAANTPGKWDASDQPSFTADGSKFAFRIDDSAVAVVDTVTGKLLRKVAAKARRTDRVLLSPDAERLIVIGDDIVVIQCKDGQTLRTVDLKGISRSANTSAQGYALSADGACLALSFDKNQIHLLKLDDGKFLQTLTGPRSMIQSIRFSLDGKWLVAAGWDRAVHVWTRGK